MRTLIIRAVWHFGRTLLAFVLASPSALGAQDSVLTTGAHVRVSASTPPLTWRTGHVVELSRDSLWLDTDDSHETLGIARSAVTTLDLRIDSGSRGLHAGEGAVLGFLAGAAIGAIPGSNCSGCDGSPMPLSAVAGAAAGGLLGMLIGTTVGIMVPTQRWAPVRLPDASRGHSESAAVGMRFTVRIRV